MPQLTPEQKLQKKARDNLKILHNRLLSAFSFKQIHTWDDASKFIGNIPEKYRTQAINYGLLNLVCKEQSDELEQSFQGVKPPSEGAKAVVEIVDSGHKPRPKFIQISGFQHGGKDTNDCTVLSLSACLDIPYQEASDRLSAAGRHIDDGMRSDWHGKYLRENGFVLVNSEVTPLVKVRDEMCKEGRYVIANHKHAFCIKDGIVYDHTEQPDNLQITRVFKYEPKTEISVLRKSTETERPTEEIRHDASDNYGLEISPNWSEDFFPYWFQKKAGAEIIRKASEGKRGLLLLAGTGLGKTFIVGIVQRWLIDHNFAEDKTFAAIPYIFVTKATILEQCRRVFDGKFNIKADNVEVINIEALRASEGQQWVKKEVYIEEGEEKERWKWKSHRHPVVICFDESQGAKNKGSTQSQIFYAYNDIPNDTVLICVSATPFTRVSEAKAFAVSTRRPLDHLPGFPKGTVLSNENWNAYAAVIASPSKPDEYNEAAVKRLMTDLDDYVVQVKGVKPQFQARNGVRIIQFENDEKREYYRTAWEKFLRQKAKLDALKEADEEVSQITYLVMLQQFAKAAEYCHAEGFADKAYQCWLDGKAPTIAVKFKATLMEICRIWIEKYHVSRDNICLVWGGGQTQATEKQKQKEKILKKAEKLKKAGIDPQEFLDELGLGDVEDHVAVQFPEHYRLGAQSLEERQREIDRFQSGKAQFAIYTLKAGGVGLSLHHTDEYTKDWDRTHPQFNEWYERIQKLPEKQRPKPGKCRRKESGFAVEEDIRFIPVREREGFVVVTYNAIELVQGVGRVPRLTSLSATVQNVYCYAGTIEVEMGHIYSQKLRCLSAVVRQREDWQDIILSAGNTQVVKQHIDMTKNAKDDETGLVDDEANGEEE